jgi:hypothetical protein
MSNRIDRDPEQEASTATVLELDRYRIRLWRTQFDWIVRGPA